MFNWSSLKEIELKPGLCNLYISVHFFFKLNRRPLGMNQGQEVIIKM